MNQRILWEAVIYFEANEFECECGCGTNNPSKDLVYKLNSARIYAGVPFTLTSACRCTKHNFDVDGLADSAHIASEVEEGEAADIAYATSGECFHIVNGLLHAGFERILIYKTFIHADVDSHKPSPILKRM